MTSLLTLTLLLCAAIQAQEPQTHSAPLTHGPEVTEQQPALVFEPEPEPVPVPEPEPEPEPEPKATTLPAPPADPLQATDTTAPAPAPPAPPPPIVIELSQPAAPPPPAMSSLADNLLPRPPEPNLLRAILLLLAVLASVGLANMAERPLGRLAPRGLLPATLKLLVVACRSGALLVAFVGMLHLVPAAWSPAVAYVLVGTALAVGWSVREVVQDVLVGLIFILERSFRSGQRLRFEGITGTLTRMTFRVTWLRTDEGADIAIPNRRLTSATLELDPQDYAPVSVLLLVPPCRAAVETRSIIRELVLLNPYLAPGDDPQVYRQADDPKRWQVKARLLDARFADRFRGTMVDMVEEVFGRLAEGCEHDPKP